MPSIICAGCLSSIESRQYLRCLVCTDTYDLQCANVSEKRFYNTMTSDHKSAWKCQRCVCRQPKGDNTNTPVRGTVAESNDNMTANDSINNSNFDACSNQCGLTAYDNVTLRRHQTSRSNSIALSCNTEDDNICMTSIRNTIREELQQALSERLSNLISKAVENHFASISNKFTQLENRLTTFEAKLGLVANATCMIQNSMAPPPGNPHKTKKSKAASSMKGSSKPVVTMSGPSKPVQLEPVPSVRRSSKAEITSYSEPDLPRPLLRATNATASSNPDDEGWTEVKRPRKLLNIKRGTATPGTTQLEASERSLYIHAYYLKIGTTDDRVRAHLEVVCGEDVCTVETLKARGNYASFKLTVPSRYAEKVMDPGNWAKDIALKPWRQLFRSKNPESATQN